MRTVKYPGVLTARTPIHHGGPEVYGTIKPILTLPTLIEDEKGMRVEDVPYIHGNAIRGYLRRLVMQDFLDQLDYDLKSAKIYHFLFTGGLLEANTKSSGMIDVKLKSGIRKYIPPASLWGSALGNQMIQGKLKVDLAEPICKELYWQQKHYCDIDGPSSYSLKARDFGTRLDSLREYKEDREDGEQATQMKYEFEVIVKGAKFYHEFTLTDTDPVEESCFIRALNLWSERPYLGGKSGSGYGKLDIRYDYDPDAEATYLSYVEEKADLIREFLDELQANWR